MKVVILAGGKGTRLSEETHSTPKPLVTIGKMPIIWHIMKFYSSYGHNEFIICCGYLGYLIKQFFTNYYLQNSDITVDCLNNEVITHRAGVEPWKVTLVDTGDETMTGGRLLRISEFVKDEPYFFMTYGDGLTNANLSMEEQFHNNHGKLATVLSVPTPGRFGLLNCEGDTVVSFNEKPVSYKTRINGGYFILSPEIMNHIEGDETIFEQLPMQTLASQQQLMAYMHDGFWQAMDTQRERHLLDNLWSRGEAPWKTWHG